MPAPQQDTSPVPAAAAAGVGRSWPTDAGLLVLRAAALFLVLTFGWEKLTGYIHFIRSGQPLASSPLASLIRRMGFPAPVLLNLYTVLCESVGAFLVACGWFTRPLACCVALSMAGAFYVSLRQGWEPLRAALYLVIFAALAIAGAGRYSLDSLLRWPKKPAPQAALTPRAPHTLVLDAGLLFLRLAAGITVLLLFALQQSAGQKTFAYHPGRVVPLLLLALGALLVTCGWLTRPAAALVAAAWLWAAYSGLRAGQDWHLFPVRAVLYLAVFAALALTGPGRFSLDGLRNARPSAS